MRHGEFGNIENCISCWSNAMLWFLHTVKQFCPTWHELPITKIQNHCAKLVADWVAVDDLVSRGGVSFTS